MSSSPLPQEQQQHSEQHQVQRVLHHKVEISHCCYCCYYYCRQIIIAGMVGMAPEDSSRHHHHPCQQQQQQQLQHRHEQEQEQEQGEHSRGRSHHCRERDHFQSNQQQQPQDDSFHGETKRGILPIEQRQQQPHYNESKDHDTDTTTTNEQAKQERTRNEDHDNNNAQTATSSCMNDNEQWTRTSSLSSCSSTMMTTTATATATAFLLSSSRCCSLGRRRSTGLTTVSSSTSSSLSDSSLLHYDQEEEREEEEEQEAHFQQQEHQHQQEEEEPDDQFKEVDPHQDTTNAENQQQVEDGEEIIKEHHHHHHQVNQPTPAVPRAIQQACSTSSCLGLSIESMGSNSTSGGSSVGLLERSLLLPPPLNNSIHLCDNKIINDANENTTIMEDEIRNPSVKNVMLEQQGDGSTIEKKDDTEMVLLGAERRSKIIMSSSPSLSFVATTRSTSTTATATATRSRTTATTRRRRRRRIKRTATATAPTTRTTRQFFSSLARRFTLRFPTTTTTTTTATDDDDDDDGGGVCHHANGVDKNCTSINTQETNDSTTAINYDISTNTAAAAASATTTTTTIIYHNNNNNKKLITKIILLLLTFYILANIHDICFQLQYQLRTVIFIYNTFVQLSNVGRIKAPPSHRGKKNDQGTTTTTTTASTCPAFSNAKKKASSLFFASHDYNLSSSSSRTASSPPTTATTTTTTTTTTTSSSSATFPMSPTTSSTTSTSWPDPPLDKFNNSTKILWGYWHSGEKNLNPISQIALQSWKAHHRTTTTTTTTTTATTTNQNHHGKDDDDNDEWTIIILSDDNYKDYVPNNHIPSTFDQLKVQHKSDLLRLSVLVRYGGAYLDMTTVMFRSLDGIWDNDGDGVDNRLYVTSVLELDDSNNHEYYPRPAMTNSNLHDEHDTLPSSTLSNRKCREGAAPNPALLNNAVLLSPRPNNPILVEFLHRSLQYSENPATSLSEIQSRPEFSRVLPHILSDKNLGLLGSESMVLYMAYLWIFTDLVMYDEILRAGELVVDLPTLRWTYDFLVLPSLMKEGASPSSLWLLVSGLFSRWCTYWKRLFLSQDYDALASSSQSYPLSSLTSQLQYERRQQQKHLRVYDWKIWNTAIRTLQMLRYAAYDEQSLASAMVEDITMIKSSSDNTNKYQSQMKTYQELVGQETTMGRMYRAAVQGTGRNATLDGARPLGYGAPRDW